MYNITYNMDNLSDMQRAPYRIDLNVKDVDGNDPLSLAASNNSIYILQELINMGMNIDTTNNNNETPLELAIKSRREESAIILIKNGASIYRDNNLLIEIAMRNKLDRVATLLIEKIMKNMHDVTTEEILEVAKGASFNKCFSTLLACSEKYLLKHRGSYVDHFYHHQVLSSNNTPLTIINAYGYNKTRNNYNDEDKIGIQKEFLMKTYQKESMWSRLCYFITFLHQHGYTNYNNYFISSLKYHQLFSNIDLLKIICKYI